MPYTYFFKNIFRFSLIIYCVFQTNYSRGQNVLPDTLVFGSDKNYPPYEFLDEKGNPSGFNIDLIKAIAEEMNFNLNIKLGNWPEIREEFEEGSIHITDMYFSEHRDENLDFATAHKIQYAEIFVDSDEKNIKSLEDLYSKKVILQKSALAHEYIKEKIPSAILILVDSEYEAIKALSNGIGDATIISSTTQVNHTEFSNVKKIGYSFLPSEYCFVVIPQNDKILRLINTGLMILKENGKFAEIDKKWFGNQPNKIVRNLLIGLILVITVIALVFYWLNSTLRKLVKKKTQDLKYSLDRLSLISKVKGKQIDKLSSKKQAYERVKFIVNTFNVDACILKFMTNKEPKIFTSYAINNFEVPNFDKVDSLIFKDNNVDDKQAFYISNKKNNIPNEKYKFYARAPLIVEDNLIGIIELFSLEEKSNFTDLDLEHLVLVADQLAVLINNTKLFEQNKQQKEDLLKQNKQQKEIEKELLASKEKAEESNRLKSAFLANMSHEIRTPMNSILGFSELLKDPDISEEKHDKFINIVSVSSKRLLNVINDIIDISKIESGTLKVYLSEVSIEELLTNTHTFFEPEIIKKGLNLELIKPDLLDKIIINTDETKLNGILINLVKNAIKYTKKGTIKFGCTIENEHLLFFVKDTGIGIPRNRQAAIFNRFEQADIEDRGAYEGVGLGLSLAKIYTEMLGGKIWVESNEEGSQFYFSIPFEIQDITETSDKMLITT